MKPLISIVYHRSFVVKISDFYLDTELTEQDLTRKSIVFKESGLTIEEIKDINYHEVGPLLINNLKSVAGVWSGFNEEELHRTLEQVIGRGSSKNLFQRFRDFFRRGSIDYHTREYFEAIERRMQSLDSRDQKHTTL